MASRGFSSSAHAAKTLKWKLKGTTVQVDHYIKAVELAVDALPSNFADKAKVGIIQGNPHDTPENNDPMHASGRIGEGSASGKKRLSSFHAYPDGTVIFSDPALKPFNKGPDVTVASSTQTAGSLSTQGQGIDWQWDQKSGRYWRWATDGKTVEWAPADKASNDYARLSSARPIPAQQQASDWVWDERSQKHKFWDGSQWVFQE